MRIRDQKARIHFTEEELRDLDRKASAAELDRSKYVRMKVLAAEVKPGPQVDIPPLIAVTHQAGLRYLSELIAVCWMFQPSAGRWMRLIVR